MAATVQWQTPNLADNIVRIHNWNNENLVKIATYSHYTVQSVLQHTLPTVQVCNIEGKRTSARAIMCTYCCAQRNNHFQLLFLLTINANCNLLRLNVHRQQSDTTIFALTMCMKSIHSLIFFGLAMARRKGVWATHNKHLHLYWLVQVLFT